MSVEDYPLLLARRSTSSFRNYFSIAFLRFECAASLVFSVVPSSICTSLFLRSDSSKAVLGNSS